VRERKDYLDSASADGMELAERVQRLEDDRAIRDLKHEYCYRLDDRDWDGTVELFTPDTVLDYGGLGTYEGRDGVRKFAEGFIAESLEATAHAVHNGVIDVDGDEATGRWYVTSFITLANGTSGVRMGEYEEQYRRCDDGEWRIASLWLRFRYSADYDDGWPDLRTHDTD